VVNGQPERKIGALERDILFSIEHDLLDADGETSLDAVIVEEVDSQALFARE
jgi:hypothetical protein